MKRASFFALLIAMSLVPACAQSPLGVADGPLVANRAESELVVGDIRIRLAIDPPAVDPGQGFGARLTLTNTSADMVTWGSGYGCIAFLNVYLGDDRVPFDGTNYGCTAVARSWPIAPGESLVTDWAVAARSGDGMPAPSGEYRFTADLGRGVEASVELVVR